MKAIHAPPKTARARLAWIVRDNPKQTAELGGPRYLIALAFLAILLLIIALAIAVGSAAAEMFGLYVHWLKLLASP